MSDTGFIVQDDGTYRISGQLTFATVAGLIGQANTWLNSGKQAVTMDLGNVSRADSAGLALMIEWVRQARQQQIDITFINIPDQLATLIRLSGLQTLFHPADATQEAN